MFINPQTAIENGWITHPACQTFNDWKENNFVSPNAIDFTLDRLFSIHHHNMFHISEHGKQMRGGSELFPTVDRRNGIEYWRLDGNTSYDGLSNMYVTIPEGVAAQIIVRSSLARNGIVLVSGLWDSGFKGNVGMVIHNHSGPAAISPGTRVGQIIFIESDNALKYAGGYNHEAGTHWSEGKNDGNN